MREVGKIFDFARRERKLRSIIKSYVSPSVSFADSSLIRGSLGSEKRADTPEVCPYMKTRTPEGES